MPDFPKEVFNPELIEAIDFIADRESIPNNFLYSTMIHAVAAFAGNQYYFPVRGKYLTSIMYMALIAPSGVGKSVANRILINQVIGPFRDHYNEQFESQVKDWEIRAAKAKADKDSSFDETKPRKIIRQAEKGTIEALVKYMSSSPAGYRLFFDEAGHLFNMDRYSKNSGNAVNDFLNINYNNQTFEDLRVDESRERYVSKMCIGIIIALQDDLMADYFTPKAVSSGVFNRFLFDKSGYVKINEDVDISIQSNRAPDQWKDIIAPLFQRGYQFQAGQAAMIKVTPDAISEINKSANKLASIANVKISNQLIGDISKYLIAYDGKMHEFFFKFCMVLALIDDYKAPIITLQHVNGAKKLYKYYKNQAAEILKDIYSENINGFNPTCLKIYDNLPDDVFSRQTAREVCKSLNLCENYFEVYYKRSFAARVDRIKAGWYLKS